MNNEITYWIALTHMCDYTAGEDEKTYWHKSKRWNTQKINNIISRIYNENKSTIDIFFSLSEYELTNIYKLNAQDVEDLKKVKQELPNYAFLAELLLNEGYEIISIVSSSYPAKLKDNLYFYCDI